MSHYRNAKYEPHVVFKRFHNSNYVENVPNSLEPIFDFVCAYFPELKNAHIQLKFSNINTTMQATPSIAHFRRVYTIYINNNQNFKGIKFSDMPQKAVIGLIAHEFSHILDYESKSTLQILLTGISYLNKKKKIDYEKAIDMLTIQKGFGYYLYAWAQFSMYESDATNEYKSFKKEVYLQPQEIKEIINKEYSENY